MPRVITKTKSTAGRAYSCGRCGRKIEPGERYYSYAFRYGGKYFRCIDHYPRQSELTQSKMSEVYAAIEDAEDALPDAETVADVRGLVEAVAEQVETTAEEYREAAEPFGGAGENADRADELDGWASELQSFDPDKPDDDDDELRERVVTQMRADGFTEDDEAEWVSVLDARISKAEAEHQPDEGEEDLVESAREAALELLGGCPL